MDISGNHFAGKHICLVLTCARPYYSKRRSQRLATYLAARKAGFEVVFLFGRGDIGDTPILRQVSGELENYTFWSLIAPIEDTYANHSKKMEHAYRYFARTGCAGILKMDDDTDVHMTHVFDAIRHDIGKRYDYFGIATASREVGVYACDKRVSGIIPAYTVHHPTTYFGGPFYWVSAAAIQQIASYGILIPYEDLGVGYALSAPGVSVRTGFLPWFAMGVVTWNSETE